MAAGSVPPCRTWCRDDEIDGWWSVVRKQSRVHVFRITGARQGLEENVRGRQRRYVILMSVRAASVVLAVTVWNVERHIAIAALVLSILLPCVAVVIANGGRERTYSLPKFVSAPLRLMIAPQRDGDPAGPVPEDMVDVTVIPGAEARNLAEPDQLTV